jgi:hypothetical protein
MIIGMIIVVIAVITGVFAGVDLFRIDRLFVGDDDDDEKQPARHASRIRLRVFKM